MKVRFKYRLSEKNLKMMRSRFLQGGALKENRYAISEKPDAVFPHFSFLKYHRYRLLQKLLYKLFCLNPLYFIKNLVVQFFILSFVSVRINFDQH